MKCFCTEAFVGDKGGIGSLEGLVADLYASRRDVRPGISTAGDRVLSITILFSSSTDVGRGDKGGVDDGTNEGGGDVARGDLVDTTTDSFVVVIFVVTIVRV
eukprot:TRINITY_DN11548_c0_g1_i1.p2 TRINITY_DN11548_c0_g1~~TRINITY_DN11548_c0_g1_i1.p2  ORF type:complete len:102 (-),score=14.68 TRINITY_DN11548_c0_g1_i1:363-668(-)